MSRRDIRTSRRTQSGIQNILSKAGQGPAALLEALESRVLLAFDHPSFEEVFNTPTPSGSVQTAPVDGSGLNGTLTIPGETDVMRFVAPANDFVRVWADTVNPGSTLDSRVEVYTRSGPNNEPTLIASGSNNGTLSSGVFIDGWAGFVAVQDQEYFVVIRSDVLNGASATGNYTLRVNGTSTAGPTLNTTTGFGTVNGNLATRGGDIVYRVTTGPQGGFISDFSFAAIADAADFDPRLDIYDAQGNHVRGDSDTGTLTDAFAVSASGQNRTFYVRLRGDRVANIPTATGAFTLNLDGIATAVPVDPITRLARTTSTLADQTAHQFFKFQSQATGLTIITLEGNGLPPVPDSALRLYNNLGVQIGFNELPNALSRMFINLTGGETYFLVVENFNGAAGGGFKIKIESNHTYRPNLDPELHVDDHQSTPEIPQQAPAFGSTEWFDLNRQFELSTPVQWGAPENAPTPPSAPGQFTGVPAVGTDHSKVRRGYVTGRIHAGGDTDLFQFVPPVDMLGEYAGHANPNLPGPIPPPLWTANHRPSTRLQILTQFGNDLLQDGFVNTRVRVFDSNFDLVYDTNDQVATIAGDHAGMLDPASFPPEVPVPPYTWTFGAGQPGGIEVWGGETYYLEVAGTGTGRYHVELMVDAEEDHTAQSRFDPTPAGAGQFANAYELRVNENTGEARNFVNAGGGAAVEVPPGSNIWTVSTGLGYPALNGRTFANQYALADLTPPDTAVGAGAQILPGFRGSPGTRGRTILQSGDLGTLTSVGDRDIYMFRALYSGYAEIWINTSQLQDSFLEAQVNTEDGNPLTPPEVDEVTKTKVYNSKLDSAIRVFDNDFNELGYNNDNGVTPGEAAARIVGGFGNRTFFRRDARFVIPVESGQNYFVQVESGQLAAFNANPDLVDWRRATGSYELLVNSMSDLQFSDDHIDFPNAVTAFVRQQATPMPLDLGVSNTQDTISEVVGTIDSTLGADSDVFTFISPGTGNATIEVGTLGNNARTVRIFNNAGALLATTTGGGSDPATVSFVANQGEQFFVVVEGDDGDYTMTLSGVPHIDDHADSDDWATATAIDKDLYDFDGTETVNGSLEFVGDSDVFSFETLTFDTANITVTPLDAGLAPLIDVYEVSQDPQGNPVFLRIARGAAGTVNVAITAPPRTSTAGTFNSYYVVVSGLNPAIHRGAYSLTLTLNNTTDDHPDQDQWEFATPIAVLPDGSAEIAGDIELAGDTDLFNFTATAQGQVTITVLGTTTMRPQIRVFTSGQTPVTDQISLGTVVTGPDQNNSLALFRFTATRGQSYFILIGGQGGGANSTETGEYTVFLSSPIPDDHANVGEFAFATNIPISSFSGTGAAAGSLEVGTDSDLFTFTSIAAGDITVSVFVPANNFRAFLRFFDDAQQEIGVAVNDGGPGDEDGVRNGRVVRTLAATQIGDQFYALVSSDQTEPTTTGDYTVFVQGQQPPPGDDDHPDAGFWDEATPILLSSLTGDGSDTGNIDNPTDTDLFTFLSISGSVLSPRKAFVQVLTAAGDPIDVGVTVFRGDGHEVVQSSETGTAGSNASAEFEITDIGERYWVLVSTVNGIESGYTVRIDTSPAIFSLFYPEGFSSPNVKEYVSIGNPSTTEDVTYSIRLRFEDTSLGELTIASNQVIPKNTRGGITISDGPNGALNGIPLNEPYAIIIESDRFLGANISHYDFNSTVGEAFTSDPSTTWTFAKGTKFPGEVNDFLVYYNPNPTAAVVTLTAYQPDGTSVAMSQIVEGFRRGGWNFNDTAQLPTGDFAFTVTSAPVDPSDEHIGIVASLSHYDLANLTGYGVLGDADGGAKVGVVPQLLSRANPTATSEVTFFNSGDTTANIVLVGRYMGTALPNVIRNVTLGAKQSITLTGDDLGLTDNQVLGLRYDSDVPVTVLGGTRQFGTTDSTQASTDAATSWFWGDAFINRIHAGSLYYEDMFFYNPTDSELPITLNFQFNTGETSSFTFNVAARDFAKIALHELPAILNHRVFNWFSIEATADQPFVAKLSHYDLVLQGGWGTKGAPLGLTTPMELI